MGAEKKGIHISTVRLTFLTQSAVDAVEIVDSQQPARNPRLVGDHMDQEAVLVGEP
jgi:hypothetical protein